MSDWRYELVPLPDGREMEVLLHGDAERVLVLFTGTPGGAVPDEEVAATVTAHGFRLVQPLRPGYGRSSPRPGRRVVDFAADVEAVLNHLEIDEAVCMGGSGGGPHSIAMAAKLPQCRAAAALVSPAPRDAADLNYYEGMGLSNQEEWLLADQGEAAVRPWIEKAVADLQPSESGESFIEQFADSFSEADREAMATGSGALMMASIAKAVERGIEGWVEDDLALTTPWGFDLGAITTPVTLWTGKQDQFVSYWHCAWLAREIPGADLHIYANRGHMSLRRHHLPEMLDDLLTKAGWATP